MLLADFIKTVLGMRKDDNSFEIKNWTAKDFKLVSDALKGKSLTLSSSYVCLYEFKSDLELIYFYREIYQVWNRNTPLHDWKV
jgi:hypothetical protein